MKYLTLLSTLLSLFAFSFLSYGQLKEVPLVERMTIAHTIIEGKVISQQSFWDDNHHNIYTANKIKIYKIFKGNTLMEELEIITVGGVVGMDKESVSPSLQFEIGQIGIFLLKDNNVAVSNTLFRTTYQMMPAAGPQGFVRYDLKEGTAHEPFHEYTTITTRLYNTITGYTQNAFTVIDRFDVDEEIMLQNTSQRGGIFITSISPTIITAGTFSVLTINGSGFGATQGSGVVQFSNADDGGATNISPLATEYISWSDVQIQVNVTQDAGTGTVKVRQGSTAISGQTLTVSYAELNANFDSGTGTEAFPTQHVDRNGNGGYIWQMHTDFDANASANASFVRAMDSWSCGGSGETGIYWEIGATTTTDIVANDNVNIIRHDNGSELSSGILGRCTSRWSGCSNGSSLEWYVEELDIVFDDGTNWQYGPAAPGPTEYDFETTAIHELGHGHQLGHVILPSAIMHFSVSNGIQNRTLDANMVTGGNDVMSRSTAQIRCSQDLMTTCTFPDTWDGSTSTDWNVSSNWSADQVPIGSDNVTIPSEPANQPHVTLGPGSPAVCNDITIDAGATLIVDAGKALTASGAIANAGTILVKADVTGIGSLITQGTVTGAGAFQMEQYLTGAGGATPNGLFYYVSNPAVGATAVSYNIASGNKLWSADETAQNYPQITNGATVLKPTQGYVVRMGASGSITLNGTSFNTGNQSATGLTRTDTNELNRGYNLAGNPYPSTVSWDDATKTNLETSMYYRTNQGSSMLYDTYNAVGSVGTNNNLGGAVTGDIPPTQAFWVRVDADENTGSVTFENADRTHGTQAGIYKVAAEEGMIRMALSDGNVSDEQIVMFNPSAQSDYEDFDSQKFWSSNVPQLYSNLAEDTLTINGLNNPTETPTVDLGMKVPVQGEYTLNATSITLTETPVHLEDRILGLFQDLNVNPVYAFSSDAGNIGDRFVLHFSTITGMSEAENNINVFSIENMVHVNLSNAETGTITVLDMSGRMVHNQAINSDRMVIDLKTAAGIYVVQVETSAQTITKKISIQQSHNH
jgi:hypothetical protein